MVRTLDGVGGRFDASLSSYLVESLDAEDGGSSPSDHTIMFIKEESWIQ